MAESNEPILEQEHPIPQQISAYQFKLVGDMTLKQFFQVAGGVLVALFFYASSIPIFIKWPLILISVLFGVALAFFPIEDRPLSTWIAAFIKSIYAPTIYVWKKDYKTMSFFKPEVGAQQAAAQATPQDNLVYQEGEEKEKSPSAKLDEKEKEFLTKVQEHFKENPAPILTPTTLQPSASTTIQPSVSVQPKPQKQIEIPKKEAVGVEKEAHPQPQPAQQAAEQAPSYTFHVSPVMGTQKMATAQNARFSAEAGPPIPPTTPNVVVGQVLDPKGKIVENAILEIRDSEGRPVRAFKTNKLGHFMIVTPLSNGKYEISTEKEGLEFSPISLEAQGKVIPPIAIWAKQPSGKETQNPNVNASRLYGEIFDKPKVTVSE